MKDYVYSGPPSGVSLKGGEGKPVDVVLIPGATVGMPDCAYTDRLVKRGMLTPVAEDEQVNAADEVASKPEAPKKKKQEE